VSAFNAGGTIGGTEIAGLALNVGGGKFEGVALSQNVTGGAQSALASSAAPSANSTTAASQASDAQKAATSDAQPPADDDQKKLLARRTVLVKYTGRVTVLLPPKAP
jgi:hypothetical protein